MRPRSLALIVPAVLALLLSCQTSPDVQKGVDPDFQHGADAYNRGDYATALEKWQPLAEEGHAGAQFNLGIMYSRGQGVPQDHKNAAAWYRRSAEQGVAMAQVNLGFAYEQGQGVPQDDAEAVRWYRLAAEQGVALAQFNLGILYQNAPRNAVGKRTTQRNRVSRFPR